MKLFRCSVFALTLAAPLSFAAEAFAVTQLVGDVDGFGFTSTAGLVRATREPHTQPADVDGDGVIEPGEYLPDLNQNGSTAVSSGDNFDHRTAAESSAMSGAQFTDRSLVGAGAADGIAFTFQFPVPSPGDADHGADHFINFVFGDYDVSPATIDVDGVSLPLALQGSGNDGYVQTAYAVVPWADMTDGQVVITVVAPSEPYLAFDYALLDTTPIAVPIAVEECAVVQRGTYGSVEDTFVTVQSPNQASGSYPLFYSGTSSSGDKLGLVRFDLDFIPQGATVTSATMSLFQVWKRGSSVARVHRASGPWSEATATYTDYGGHDAAVEASLQTIGGGFGFLDAYVLDAVQDWVDGAAPNHGFVVEEDFGPAGTSYRASEYSTVADRPMLEVCYSYYP